MAVQRQYGAIPYLFVGGKLRVVLITSRTNRNWIFPKGRRIPGMSRADTALQEAMEEAGLRGRRAGKRKFRATIKRPGKTIDLTLYPMKVDRLMKRWPEQSQRRRVVVSVQRAEDLLAFAPLKQMLRHWATTRR